MKKNKSFLLTRYVNEKFFIDGVILQILGISEENQVCFSIHSPVNKKVTPEEEQTTSNC